MFCGTRSFSHVDDDGSSPSSKTLKQSFSMGKKKKGSSNQNPYSTSGLDKFEKVLQELDKKKERIMLRAKSHGDATVRFTYKTGSEEWIPIIIKKRDAKEKEENRNARTTEASVPAKRLSAPPSLKVERESKGVVNKTRVVNRELRRSYGLGRGWYWPLAIVLVVLVLLMFGRSFAICWTTMLWYLVPMVKSRSKGLRRKELGRGVSDKS